MTMNVVTGNTGPRRRRAKTALGAALLLCALGAAALMTGGLYTLDSGRVVGIAGQASQGNSEVTQIFGEAVGLESMSGGGITVEPGAGPAGPSAAASLGGAYCYPSPFRPSRGHTKLTFTQLKSSVSLKVFDLSGGLVYSETRATPAGELQWAVVNNRGSALASGVYIYLITSGVEKKTGRFAVIR